MSNKLILTLVKLVIFISVVECINEPIDLNSKCVFSCKDIKGIKPSCNSCHAFFNCELGHEIEQFCPQGHSGLLFFDGQVCSTINKLRCGLDELVDEGPPIDGGLSDYGPWSDCSRSCGGGISTRRRYCNDPKPLHGGKQCIGDLEDSRACNQYLCPDCDRQCPGGTLVDCTYCNCTGVTLEGRVLYKTSVPLQGVKVYDIYREWASIAESDVLGEYSISDVCMSSLQLKFKKEEFYSELDIYQAEYSSPLVMEMFKQEAPIFTLEPVDTAAFVGQTVTMQCKAQVYPPVVSYEWYKDQLKVQTDGVTTGISTLVIEEAKLSDSGHYACRAVSEIGNKFTYAAELVVSQQDITSRTKRGILENERNSCEKTPTKDVNLYYLPNNCYAKIDEKLVNVVDLGSCHKSACQFVDGHANNKYHCGVLTTTNIKIKCPEIPKDYSFNLPIAKECGCVRDNSENIVGIKGIIETVDKSATPEVDIVIGDKHYSLHTGNKFYFETVPVNKMVVFHVLPSNSHMPRTVALDLTKSNVDEVFAVVKLNARPLPVVVNSTIGGKITVQSRDGLDAVLIGLPGNSMVNNKGLLIDGDVSVFITFDDAKNENGLETTPGHFTQIDEAGMPALLNPFGVLSIFVQQHREPIFIQGNIKIVVFTKNLGIPKSENTPSISPAKLYTFQESSGLWSPISELVYKKNPNKAKAKVQFPAEYPIFVSINELLPKRKVCQVSVRLYSDSGFGVPLSGELVSIVTYRPGKVVGYTTAITNVMGRACVSVPCGHRHRLNVGPSTNDVIVLAKFQDLPLGFNYTRIDGRSFQFNSEELENIKDLEGPVYPYSTGSCDNKPKYGFKLALVSSRPLAHGKLFSVNSVPNEPLSWYSLDGNNKERKTCMLRLDVLTMKPEETFVFGKSINKNNEYLGLYVAKMVSAYNPYTFTPLTGNYRTCVQVKCPSENDFIIAKIKINSPITCKYRTTYLVDEEIIRHTDYKLKIKLNNSAFESDNKGLYSAKGIGNSGYREALNKCINGGAYTVLFDCSDINIKHLGWG